MVLFVSALVHTENYTQYNPGFVGTRNLGVGGHPWSMATADLNHDGIPDVVFADGSITTVDTSGVSHTTIYGVVVLVGNGGGAYKAAVRYATRDSASFVTMADLDGAGISDIITASDDPSLLAMPGSSPGGSDEPCHMET